MFGNKNITKNNICFSFGVFVPDVGFEISNRFVVGYALDYNEYFRDLNVRAFLISICQLFIEIDMLIC